MYIHYLKSAFSKSTYQTAQVTLAWELSLLLDGSHQDYRGLFRDPARHEEQVYALNQALEKLSGDFDRYSRSASNEVIDTLGAIKNGNDDLSDGTEKHMSELQKINDFNQVCLKFESIISAAQTIGLNYNPFSVSAKYIDYARSADVLIVDLAEAPSDYARRLAYNDEVSEGAEPTLS